jgi:hypothetical protein
MREAICGACMVEGSCPQPATHYVPCTLRVVPLCESGRTSSGGACCFELRRPGSGVPAVAPRRLAMRGPTLGGYGTLWRERRLHSLLPRPVACVPPHSFPSFQRRCDVCSNNCDARAHGTRTLPLTVRRRLPSAHQQAPHAARLSACPASNPTQGSVCAARNCINLHTQCSSGSSATQARRAVQAPALRCLSCSPPAAVPPAAPSVCWRPARAGS